MDFDNLYTNILIVSKTPSKEQERKQIENQIKPKMAYNDTLTTFTREYYENITESNFDKYWNSSNLWNVTNLTLGDYEVLSSNTTRPHGFWHCSKWSTVQQDLYQTANLCLGLALLIPTSFKQSILILRLLSAIAFILLAVWGGKQICAPDILAWSFLLFVINAIHTALLFVRFLPPALSLELTELYLKLFRPFKVSKKHFNELSKESIFVKLEPGETYAIEDVTVADERLSILLKGKLRVTCNDTHLHYIQPHQFVDSPEWEANREQSDDVFQVTIIAEESSLCLTWSRMKLERVLRHRPMLKVVLDCLIGKDITHKLYSLSEFSGVDVNARQKKKIPLFTQVISASVDAVNESARGTLRSFNWKSKNSYDPVDTIGDSNPMIARHFLKETPFKQRPPTSFERKLVSQSSSASLQPTPLAKIKFNSRKATSLRKAREVKFAEPHHSQDWADSSEGSVEWSPGSRTTR